MQRLEIQVWSDMACPWCFVGKRRLERALRERSSECEACVRWRAFELDPSAPTQYPERPSYHERLARKYGFSPARALQMIDNMQRIGQSEGIRFDFDRIQASNTFDAHRLLCSVADPSTHNDLAERLFLDYFSEGRRLSEFSSLLASAECVGLEPDRVSALLHGNDFAAEVRHEQRLASELGVHGVPFFVIGPYAVSGAQPHSVLVNIVDRALEATATSTGPSEAAAGSEPGAEPICTPEVCK